MSKEPTPLKQHNDPDSVRSVVRDAVLLPFAALLLLVLIPVGIVALELQRLKQRRLGQFPS